jgi:DNA-binding PucR family transcriptional regulator
VSSAVSDAGSAKAGASAASLPGRELARLRALSKELSAALADIHEATSREPGSPGARSLARLVRGDGRAQDEVRLGVVVPESRLLSVSVASARQGQLLIDDLGAEGRVVGLLHAEDEVLFLVPDLPSRDGTSRSREAAERVARRALALLPTATIGISSPLQAVYELPTALDEARHVDRFGEGFAFADDRWAELGVTRLADELGRCLTLSNPLNRLVQNEMLADSVAAWLEHGRNVPTAAAAINVHPNTLRYRLNRVLDVTGLDLSDPDAMLLTQLVLRRRSASQ